MCQFGWKPELKQQVGRFRASKPPWPIAVAFSRTESLEVMVINPKASHNFAKVLMKRSKTDAIDAETLAIYCERMPFEAWQRPADENIALRAMGRRIAALTKLKTQTKNQLHALSATQDTPDIVRSQTEELIEVLERQIKAHRDSACPDQAT